MTSAVLVAWSSAIGLFDFSKHLKQAPCTHTWIVGHPDSSLAASWSESAHTHATRLQLASPWKFSKIAGSMSKFDAKETVTREEALIFFAEQEPTASHEAEATQAKDKNGRRRFLSLASAALITQLALGSMCAPGDAEAAPQQPDDSPASSQSSSPVTLGRILKSKLGFSFFYPDGFIVATNRKGDEDRQPDGSQALALVGNFATFETISVVRYPVGDTSNLASPADLAIRLLPGGNVRTDYLSATQREPGSIPIGTDGIYYDYEYITEVCRGTLEEGKGGVPDCLSPKDGSFLTTIVRHHVANVIAHGGDFYVISASASDQRWPEVANALRASVSSFSFT